MTTNALNSSALFAIDKIRFSDPRSYSQKVFPLKGHVLYGDVDSFDSAPYLTPAALSEYTSRCDLQPGVTNLEICPACFFSTSGTTTRSKQVPYSDADIDRQRIHQAVAFHKLGMKKGDCIISLGSPMPSISGWAIVNASAVLGAKALNDSQVDYEKALEPENRERATIVIGTPFVLREIGLAIEQEFGSLRSVFPNLRMAIIFGDVLPDELRADIIRIWGDHIAMLSLYGTVEADVVATESPTKQGIMHLMSERLIFELIPESEIRLERENAGYVPKIVDIDSVAPGTIGDIIISDLSREVLPIVRYRIGDIVQVKDLESEHLGRCISVLGRAKNTILLAGVPLYEMQLTAALDQSIRGRFSDWRLVRQAKRDGEPDTFRLSIEMRPGESLQEQDRDCIIAAVVAQRPELAEVDVASLIEIEPTAKLNQDQIKGDTKARRIVLDVVETSQAA